MYTNKRKNGGVDYTDNPSDPSGEAPGAGLSLGAKRRRRDGCRDTRHTSPPPDREGVLSIRTIVPLDHIELLPVSGGPSCTFVPLRRKGTTTPIRVRLSGGGKIPGFGFNLCTYDTKKFVVQLGIADDAEHAALDRICSMLMDVAVDRRSTWFRGRGTGQRAPDAALRADCQPLVRPRRPKSDGTGLWPSLLRCKMSVDDVRTGHVVDASSGGVLGADDVPGNIWSEAVVEMRMVYIQQSGKYGISTMLKHLSVSCTGSYLGPDDAPL